MNENAENSRNPWQVGEVLEKTLVERAQRSSDRLRTILTSKIIIELTETKRRYLIDWTTKEMVVTLTTPDVTADTIIRTSERALQAIVKGDLNPQLAFVSGTVQLIGKIEPAIYFFNLLVE